MRAPRAVRKLRQLRMLIWLTPFITGGVRAELLKLADELAVELGGAR